MNTAQKRQIGLHEINLEHFQKQIGAAKRFRADREALAKFLAGTCPCPGDISRCKWITTCQKCRFGLAAWQVDTDHAVMREGRGKAKPRTRRNQKTEAQQ